MTIYYVKANGQGEGGTLPTLAAAAALARPGDEVVVGPGTYSERLACKTNNVSWRSETPGAAVIVGGWRGQDEGDNSNWVGIGGSGVTFRDFTIRNVPGRALYVAGDNCHVEGLRIDYTGTAGLIVADCKGTVVRGVVLTRASMNFESGHTESAAGSLMVIRSEDCVVEDCEIAYCYGEGLNLGRGGRRNVARRNRIYDNAHLGLYLNRSTDCIVEDNLIFLTGYEPRNVGADRWPAGIVIGDEGSERMRTHPHSARNTVTGNVVVNCGSLVDVRNNVANYDTQLDRETVIQHNTLIAGPCTRIGFNMPANRHGRAHEAALIADNVIDMSHAQAGATAVNGGVGPRWLRNGWSVAPDVVARSASDVTGVLGLGNPGAALANEFPEPEHSLVLDNYRPVAGSPLIGAGIDGATIGALEPDGVTPPPPPPPPPPVVVDWATLRGMVAAAATYLAATGANVAEAQKHADGAAALLNLAMLRLADAQQEQTRAAAEMAALLAKMNEYQQAA